MAYYLLMTEYKKYTPPPWLSRLLAISMALHVLMPASTIFQLLDNSHNYTLIKAVVLIWAYLAYLVFAIVLHKEYFPDNVFLAGIFTFTAPTLALIGALIFSRNLSFLTAVSGNLIFTPLSLAVIILLSAGSQLRQSNKLVGLSWHTDGKSLWTDPDFLPMVRWSVGLVFIVPIILGILLLTPYHFPLRNYFWSNYGSFASVSYNLFAFSTMTWLYLRLLANLAVEGRIFGPGKEAFHR